MPKYVKPMLPNHKYKLEMLMESNDELDFRPAEVKMIKAWIQAGMVRSVRMLNKDYYKTRIREMKITKI